MAKVSNNRIPDFSTDWGLDPTNQLPYSGKAVQEILKLEINSKISESNFPAKARELIDDVIFDKGKRSVVTDIEGNSELLILTVLSQNNTVANKTINIGRPDVNDRFISITSQLSNNSINVGGQVSLGFGFVITDYQNDAIANSFANASITVTRQGSQSGLTIQVGTVQSAAQPDLITLNVDLTLAVSKILSDSGSVSVTLSVSHTYSYIDEDGETRTKTITKYANSTITIVNLLLTSSINIANNGIEGQISIPYNIKGNGYKTVVLYRNGDEIQRVEDIVNTNQSGVFIDNLTQGVVNYQLVAFTRSDDVTVTSLSIYFDLFKSSPTTVIALKIVDPTGAILNRTQYPSPEFNVPMFSLFSFNYYIYNSQSSTCKVNIITEQLDLNDNVLTTQTSSQTMERELATYSKSIKSGNKIRVSFITDNSEKVLQLSPMGSNIMLDLPQDSILLNLDADGRSNEESLPDNWTYGNHTTQFSGFNWKSNGWMVDEGSSALVLKNGAKAIIDYPLFSANSQGGSVSTSGCTFEILFKCDNASLDENDIISCYWNNNLDRKTGLNITTSYVGVDTGDQTTFHDEDSNLDTVVATRVGSQYQNGTYYKFTFVIDPRANNGGGLCYGYIDGILSYIANTPSSFMNGSSISDYVPIVIDSTHADVYIKSIKYYSLPFTSDQCVDSFIVDQGNSNVIENLYQDNNILSVNSQDNKFISPQRLHEKGRGVMIISPSSTLAVSMRILDLNKIDNKSNYYGPFRIDYFAPASDLNLGGATVNSKGDSFNFLHTECAIRIQGTTSTKRPRKNYRLHLNKRDKNNSPSSGSFIVGGFNKSDFKYSMSRDALSVPLLCLKTDFVDSSMTHNTGGALVFNELTKNIAQLRNPAQNQEFTGDPSSIKTRVAIEGFPIDVFAADGVVLEDYTDILEDSNYVNLEYLGLYNFNNDKSKSGSIFGFDGAYTDVRGHEAICLEFLNNQEALDLFQVKFNEDGSINDLLTYSNLPNALEVRAPEGLTDLIADKGLSGVVGSDYQWVASAVQTLYSFIGNCAKEVVLANGRLPIDLNTMTSREFEELDWTSSMFTAQASEHFNMYSVCAWYIWTDYLLAVDQRAKNMMMYTMDSLHWMFQYYDGDTMLGERNDCFLAYDYLTDRDTLDSSSGQYAIQGHDSWLWYLVRANFDDMLKETCQLMRNSGKFSAEYFDQIFNKQFVANWSKRQYNYSQQYKYIQPLTETGYPSGISTNYINTALGSREAHRSHFINNRFNLLDSKYMAGNYITDAFIFQSKEGSTNTVNITASIPYYFAWRTDNTGIVQHLRADASNNYGVTLTVTGNTANNPASILGASRISELEITPSSSWIVNLSKPVQGLPNLLKLIAKNMGVNASGLLYVIGCPLLSYVDISNTEISFIDLSNNGKLNYVDVLNTRVNSVRFLDGCSIETFKITAPTELYLSNLDNLIYNDLAGDTLIVNSFANLSKLLINGCKNINWEKLVAKLINSSSSQKFLRITGLELEKPITWLDTFKTVNGLDFKGNEVEGYAQLIGTLYLPEYVDDDIVAQYKNDFPSLTIKLPEYTLIEIDEMVTDESGYASTSVSTLTNLDNSTGLHGTTSVTYQPSGHINSILKGCHRYLGKLILMGSTVELQGNPNDTDAAGRVFPGRGNDGVMLLTLLADKNSNYFASGYEMSSTRVEANLSGAPGYGEVYVKIPGFWYKGINYNKPENAGNFSRRYLAFSTLIEKPSTSKETRSLSIDYLHNHPLDDGNNEGLYLEGRWITISGAADNVTSRISTTTNASFNIYRINVEGYKKIRYPITISETSYPMCCVFTDREGNVISNSGQVRNVGELVYDSSDYAYNGMSAIATIPENAVYFFLNIRKFKTTVNSVSIDNWDVVLHKGTNYVNGSLMNETNAREWIADMEPDWVYSDPVCIAAAECSATLSSTGLFTGLYTSFNKTQRAARGIESLDGNTLTTKKELFQYSFRDLAYLRGLLLIDYEATKLIAILFVAKYGRRNSLNVLGAGSTSASRLLGITANYGMTDTILIDDLPLNEDLATFPKAIMPVEEINGTITYTDVTSPTFIGIENVIGNAGEWLDRAYYANEAAAYVGKLRITMPDLSERRVLALNSPTTIVEGSTGYYPVSIVGGKYFDILGCSSTSKGDQDNGYCDSIYCDVTSRNQWANTKAIRRSGTAAYSDGGVFYVIAGYSVSDSHPYSGSRLMFRGEIIETQDINEFLTSPELRS